MFYEYTETRGDRSNPVSQDLSYTSPYGSKNIKVYKTPGIQVDVSSFHLYFIQFR